MKLYCNLIVFLLILICNSLKTISNGLSMKTKHSRSTLAFTSVGKVDRAHDNAKEKHFNYHHAKIKSQKRHMLDVKKSKIQLPSFKVLNIKKDKSLSKNKKKDRTDLNEIAGLKSGGFINKGIDSNWRSGLNTKGRQKDRIPSTGTRSGPNTNIITDLQVPKMGHATQWIPDQQNNSKTETSQQPSDGAPKQPTMGDTGNSDVSNSKDQVDVKIKNLLDALGDPSNPTGDNAKANNMTAAKVENEFNREGYRNSSGVKDVTAQKKQIIGPGYYEPECDDEKKCPDGHYCHMYVCMDCHHLKHACTHREQCCNNMECVYGRCEQKPKGSPGAFCHKDKDCAGDACCVLEPTVDEDESICKPKLAEYHQCSPILFRKVWIGDNKPDCGPCRDGLKCTQKGNEGSHEVCMKET